MKFGKTTLLIEKLKMYEQEYHDVYKSKPTICILSFRKSFTNELHTKLKNNGFGDIVNYLDINRNNVMNEPRILI